MIYNVYCYVFIIWYIIYLWISIDTSVLSVNHRKSINAYFFHGCREEMVKVNKESKHSMSYPGRVKTLCLQKNSALWIGTGGGYMLLLDLSTLRLIRIIHDFCDSVRVMMTAQIGTCLSFEFFACSLGL